MEREPVAQAINAIIKSLEIIARMATDPATSVDVAAEEIPLWTVRNHAEWILSYIKTKRDAETRLRVVQ